MKPAALPVRPDQVPRDLRAIDRWVCWRYVERAKPDGTKVWAKLPMTASGRAASSTNPATWTTFDDACDAFIVGDFDGIGLVLGDDIQGVDLDDHRDPTTGELSSLAQELLERVDGYAEVSPSGTGIKLFSRTNLDASRASKDAGVELYRAGRYFTVTGQAINGHGVGLPGEVQDLAWLVDRVWGASMSSPVVQGSGDELALALYRPPLEDWDLVRIRDEIGPHLDPEMHYDEWIKVGQAIYHQCEGDDAGFEVWDEMFQGSSKYSGPEFGWERWRSFKAQRPSARGPVTLASLLKQTADARKAAGRQASRSALEVLEQSVADCADAQDLQDQVASRIAATPDLTDIAREKLAAAIQSRAKALGVKLPIGTVRGWLRPKGGGQGGGFVHVSPDGAPLCTLENMRALLDGLGWTVRYNVIKKAIEILIPGAGFSRDNRDNAAIACVLSECEKVRMPTKHVAQFLIRIADENAYNPVATWIESSGWDGVSRVQEFCQTVVSSSPLKDLLIRKWMLQAVAAAMSPDGVAAQGILTFVGQQNIGKTTWFERLAPGDLDVVLTGHTLDPRSKDSVFVALSHWLVELGELDATFKKADVSALKSFATQPVDKIRRPYAATESHFGRRTVFGGTVNEEKFLSDPTGNRRFYALETTGFFYDHKIDMQQVWAELLVQWRAGESWRLSREEVAELNAQNLAFTAPDPIQERLAMGFAWGEDVQEWEWITATEALMRIGIANPTRGDATKAGMFIRRLNGGRQRDSMSKSLLAVPGSAAEFLSGT